VTRRSAVVAGIVVVAVGVVAAAVVSAGGDDGGSPGTAASAPDAAEAPAREAPARLRRLIARLPGRPPPAIVMVVFDELPLVSLLGPGSAIDGARYPAFARLARESVWFRGATAVHDSTALAVPAMLDGRYPRARVGSDAASHPHNLFTELAGRYELHVSEEATGLCPPDLCTPTPGDTLSHLGHGRVERYRRWVRSIAPRQDEALWFKHVLLPHVPWRYLPSGTDYRRENSEPIPGLNAERGFGDPWVMTFAHQRHLLQLGFADRLLGELLARLRRTGLMRRALVLVVADHGISFHPGAARRTVTPANVEDLAPVPLFLKLPGQRRGLTVDRHVETVDVLPTLLAAAGAPVPPGIDGRTLLRPDPERARRVTIYHRVGTRLNTVGGSYRFPVATVVRRRDAAVRRKLALFGSGGGRAPARLFRIGPDADLIGRDVSELARVGGPGAATIDQAAALRDVKPGSGYVPAELTGTVRRSGSGGRPIAVAVNGRITAAGRTFVLAGSRAEQFAVMVPEPTFRAGRNVVRLYEVVERGGEPALKPL
jgi:hypothetical protein